MVNRCVAWCVNRAFIRREMRKFDTKTLSSIHIIHPSPHFTQQLKPHQIWTTICLHLYNNDARKFLSSVWQLRKLTATRFFVSLIVWRRMWSRNDWEWVLPRIPGKCLYHACKSYCGRENVVNSELRITRSQCESLRIYPRTKERRRNRRNIFTSIPATSSVVSTHFPEFSCATLISLGKSPSQFLETERGDHPFVPTHCFGHCRSLWRILLTHVVYERFKPIQISVSHQEVRLDHIP